MKKGLLSISSAFLLGIGLVGCGVNNQTDTNDSLFGTSGQTNNGNTITGDGQAFQNVNDRGFNDQQMFDQIDAMNVGHDWGDGQQDIDIEQNREQDLGEQKGAYSQQRGNFGYNAYNYHGQLHTMNKGQPTKSYHTGHDNVIAQKITDRIEHMANVNDVAAIIDGNTILVALDTSDNDNQRIEKEVRSIVEPMARGREVRVVTDKGMFDRVQNMKNK